tara:strand:+ start:15 stop:536 length:522 start_codon:yes stop_codon:yes gene_type:complete
MKLDPIYNWWKNKFDAPVEMRIGFRANERRRANNMNERRNKDGLVCYKDIIGRSKTGNRNRWGDIPWQDPKFPLIDDLIFKDNVVSYWKEKPVRFAYMNNCIGCFHRNPVLLKHMSNRHPNKYQWFVDAEKDAGYGALTFKNGYTYERIRENLTQLDLFDEDFNECDSGYCGL